VISVDKDGNVGLCFDSAGTNTPDANTQFALYCATSINHAATWSLLPVANSVLNGFDAATSDFLLKNDGFFGSFELQNHGNRFVQGRSF
jgi:hypothetical protein